MNENEIENENENETSSEPVKVRDSTSKSNKKTVHIVEDDGTIRCKTRYAAEQLSEPRDATKSDVTCKKCLGEKKRTAATSSGDERVEQLRFAVRFAYDIQHMRISQGNRAGPQAEHALAKLDEGQKQFLAAASERLLVIEKDAFSEVKRLLQGVPIYEQWLKHQKGVGPTIAGVIVSMIDIRKSETCAGLWALCGLAVDGAVQHLTVRRANASTVADVVRGLGIASLKVEQQGEDVDITAEGAGVLYGVMKHLREKAPPDVDIFMWSGHGEAQRRRKGEKAGFNPWLKAKMLEVLGGSLLKAKNETYSALYKNYRQRKEQEIVTCMLCNGTKVYEKKPCGNCEGTGRAKWGKSDAHRHRAGLRYMVKMFLREMWVQWRTLEGLSVRVPYEEEYLGRRHHS